MKAEIETTENVLCPSCGNRAWSIDRSFHKVGQRYNWSGCSDCGARYYLTVLEDGVDLEAREERDIPAWLVFKLADSDPPIYFVDNHPIFYRDQNGEPADREEGNHFWIEEHTCPSNLLRVAAIVTEGDDDPHGILEYVAQVPKAKPDEDYPEEGWAAFIQRIITVE